MERSAIRDSSHRRETFPGFAALHPGYGISLRPSLRAQLGNPSSNKKKEWIASSLRCARNDGETYVDDKTHLRDLAVYAARVLLSRSALSNQGRRECRASDAPDSGVCKSSGSAHTLVRSHQKNIRHSPRNGLRLMSYSPRRSGFLVTVAPEKFCFPGI